MAHAESASVTIRAACDQNPNMGAANCPRGTRANPAPICEDEPENSTDSFVERRLNCQTLGEALLGNERSCLDSHNVPASARIAASDLNRFVDNCEFRPHTPYQDIQDLTCVGQAQARDAQINNTYQDLAARSVAQINCRLDTINQYFAYRPPTNNPAPKAAMIAAARAKFDQVKARVRGLIYSKQVLLERARERNFQNTRYCMGTGCGGPVAAGQRERAQIEANYEGAIAAEIAKIPFGYEPDVATAFVAMAQSGEFDETAFENALIGTFNKYNGLRTYYDQRTTRVGNGVRYCIDSQFKEFAVSSGVMGQLLDAYPPNIMSPTTRDIVRCRLESKYSTVGRRADSIMNGVFLVGAGAAAVLTAIPTGGGSLATYGAVAGVGLSVTSFAYQVQQANQACRTRNFLISSTGGEQCNAAEDFQKEVSQFSLTNCLAQTGLAALEAIPILPEVAALSRSSRLVNSADEIADAAADAARAEASAARSRPRPAEDASGPRASARRETPEPAAPQGRRSRDTRGARRADAGEAAGDAAGATGRRTTRRTAEAGDSASTAGTTGRRSREALPEHVPENTAPKRLADEHIADENVRLSDSQERMLAQETFERKREVDRLIGGRAGRDIHDEQAELNRYLERNDLEGYIRNRGFGRERAQNLREAVNIMQRERTVLTRARVNRDLDNLRAQGATTRNVECEAVNALNSTPAFHSSAKCAVVTLTRDLENYCSCGGHGRLGAWLGPCAEHILDYLTPSELADRDALPTDSARGLQECKRVRVRAGTTMIQGGLRPTMSGHGGAAQMFVPSRGMAPRTVNGVLDSSRLDNAEGALRNLGITRANVTDAPQIDVIAVAPLHPSPEVTRIFSDGRVCGGPGNCSIDDVNALNIRFTLFARQHPEQVTDLQRAQFQEWTEWLRGCRSIDLSGGSSYGDLNLSLPGCRR